MRELVAKPSAGRVVLWVGASIVFTIGGILMLFADPWFIKLIGAFFILFFGVGGVFALIRTRRTGITFIADGHGLHPGNGGFVAWENVGEISVIVLRGINALLKVEILDVRPYLQSLDPEQRRRAASRFGNRALADVVEPGATEREGPESMGWVRTDDQRCSLQFASLALNRPVAEWAERLSAYRDEALRRRGH
ncbi:STM3941 family protein [Enemella sp. A6]|uniref:STM3941 family protein n=1 Tax=Enemella sp. A6 TaxID=3440152 RepID=UPI003EBAB642